MTLLEELTVCSILCKNKKKQINKLTSENSEAKEKLKELHAHKKPLKQSNLNNFLSSQLVDVDSTDDDATEDNKPNAAKTKIAWITWPQAAT